MFSVWDICYGFFIYYYGVEWTKFVFPLTGKNNFVFMQDLATLRVASEALQLTKPSVNVVQVEPLQECHLLAAGTTKADQTFVCAAATDRIR